jgi:hypothetical protein
MKQKHPLLKGTRAIVAKKDIKEKPSLSDFTTINEFINGFIDWIKDESLKGYPFYLDKEKIDYIYSEMDDTMYGSAKKKDRSSPTTNLC